MLSAGWPEASSPGESRLHDLILSLSKDGQRAIRLPRHGRA